MSTINRNGDSRFIALAHVFLGLAALWLVATLLSKFGVIPYTGLPSTGWMFVGLMFIATAFWLTAIFRHVDEGKGPDAWALFSAFATFVGFVSSAAAMGGYEVWSRMFVH